MSDTILVGRKDQINPIPAQMWARHLAEVPQHAGHRLAFMTPAHHRVRYFVVRELPVHGRPIEPPYQMRFDTSCLTPNVWHSTTAAAYDNAGHRSEARQMMQVVAQSGVVPEAKR